MRAMEKWDKGKLEQLWRQQQLWRPRESLPRSLKASVDMFMRRAVIPRQKKLAQLARGWVELLSTNYACWLIAPHIWRNWIY